MREYAKVSPQFWINDTGKKIKKLGLNAQLIALYLLTNPHATMLGIYYLPVAFIAHETGLSLEGALKGLQDLCEINFCSCDEISEYIWVHDMASDQISTQLKASDNRVKAINEAYSSLPNLSFLQKFYEKYVHAFFLEPRHNFFNSFEAPLKPLRSKEQEQEKEQEKKQEKEQEKDICTESENDSVQKKYSPLIKSTSFSKIEQSTMPLQKDESLSLDAMITIPLHDNTEFLITKPMINEWRGLYPNVDVLQVLRNIRGWNLVNTKKRKTKSGILKHINSWLAKEQNSFRPDHVPKPSNISHLQEHNHVVGQQWLTSMTNLTKKEVN